MISLLCPVRNEAKHLRDMVASLQAQTDASWEAVFVDDGSSDGTAEILRDLATEDTRIRIVPTSGPLGKVAAFNACFRASKGDAICHIGGDDTAPPTSLASRAGPLRGLKGTAATFCKFRTMDENGQGFSSPLPRGPRGSTSSAGTTMNRALADLLFPIPEGLPAEDIWLGRGSEYIAETVIHVEAVVLNYRQHVGNSNPRGRPYGEMTEAIHSRQRAKQILCRHDLPLSDDGRQRLALEWAAEVHRYRGQYTSLLRMSRLPLRDRVGILSMSHPALWQLRKALGIRATGWRGR
ncbi:glycosyltransferase family 2 protein [Janibacter sp. GS2]|uniref:glycosyltransferase family 2 protein n=1 Tax=Janibacter sp. GS2 TaxID=3442646 RepID=UPI003EB957C1